jgi:hypothetical protein
MLRKQLPMTPREGLNAIKQVSSMHISWSLLVTFQATKPQVDNKWNLLHDGESTTLWYRKFFPTAMNS